MRMRKLAIGLILALPGCMTTGSTVQNLSYNPSQVVYEYTRWYAGEYQVAFNYAQTYCSQFGRNAVMAQSVPAGQNPIDRIMVTFNCVTP